MNRLLLIALLCLPSVVFAADDQWHWVKVGNNADHAWDISQGNAEVTINGGQFTAKLLDSSGKDVQISLKGSIAKGKLTVKETVNNSDYTGSTYTGTLTIQKWAEAFAGATGVETTTLSDGLGMIGLTRTIKK
jgi:hypothetical protein